MKNLVTKEEILQAIKECAEELGHPPKLAELLKLRPIPRGAVYRKFGNYQSALRECGLEGSGPGYQIDLKPLFEDWAGVARMLGRLPSMMEYDVHGKYSAQPLMSRYKAWTRVPMGMQECAHEAGLEAEWADVMEMIAQRRSSVRTAVLSTVPGLITPKSGRMAEQPIYGAPLTITPLTYAPTCEGGVMFLFGALAPKLGFAVERIQTTAFPDCEAMREVKPGQWQRRWIEFELESRNFLAHGHPADGCDIIVCWSDNWPECPLEVIELRRVMEELKGRVG